MPLDRLDLAALRRWVITARADLAAYAQRLNDLNVFPVPDGDTGSNLLMTMSDAVDELDRRAPDTVAGATAAMAQATLVAARGNSGVILSQLSRGVSEVAALVESADGGADGGAQDGAGLGPQHLAAVLARAAQLAQNGVSAPVPGTILTVAAAAADSATAVCHHGAAAGLTDVIDAAVGGAAAALLRTRWDNPVLAQAGVVDAGGAGYLLVLEALQRVVHGEGGLAVTGDADPEWLRISRQTAAPAELAADCGTHAPVDGPAYEVMFLLEQATDAAVEGLKDTLHHLGDSLVVAGGPDRHSVHVHVDDVAGAVNAGVAAGRAHRFRITRFEDQRPSSRADFVILALAAGQGAAHEFTRAGLTAVTDWRDGAALRARFGRRGTLLLCASPEAYDAVAALHSAGTPGPHAGNVVAVGRDAAQALAAGAVLDPGAGFDAWCAAAREAAADVRSARVVGDPGDDALMQQIDGLIGDVGDAELVTLVTGDALAADRVDRLLRGIGVEHPGLRVTHVAGGVGEPLLTIGVE